MGLARNGLLLAVLLAASLAGCFGGKQGPAPPDGTPGWTPCVHPWPCADGSEWPAGLEGPFGILPAVRAAVAAPDGVPLSGWLIRPDVPEGTRLPTVLLSTPYAGTGAQDPGTPAYLAWTRDGPGRHLVEAGFVWAVFNVRGTGQSGGCLSPLSAVEQADQVALVEWLAAQPWSNGRVGMMGMSYPGTTPFEAAVHAPAALKAILVAGTFPDLYQHDASPQGANRVPYGPAAAALIDGATGLAPPDDTRSPDGAASFAQLAPDRLCPETAALGRQAALDPWVSDRNAAFWLERRLTDRFPDVTAAVFLAQGFRDGNRFVDDNAWSILSQAPKRFAHGPWEHEFPRYVLPGWNETVVAWFDFWLKGVGPLPEGLGAVHYLDDAGVWRDDTAWPPTASREEVLYLVADGLAPAAAASDASFVPAPLDLGLTDVESEPELGQLLNMLCPASTDAGVSVAFATPPLEAPATLAGNPFASLSLTVQDPGGMFTAILADVGPEFSCLGTRVQQGARLLGYGAVDLRFANGNFVAQPPPVGTPFQQRVDFPALADTVPAGHRVVVALARGETLDRQGAPPAYSAIHVLGDGSATSSHMVLPVLEGTLGGAAPTLAYPPRPHLPPAA